MKNIDIALLHGPIMMSQGFIAKDRFFNSWVNYIKNMPSGDRVCYAQILQMSDKALDVYIKKAFKKDEKEVMGKRVICRGELSGLLPHLASCLSLEACEVLFKNALNILKDNVMTDNGRLPEGVVIPDLHLSSYDMVDMQEYAAAVVSSSIVIQAYPDIWANNKLSLDFVTGSLAFGLSYFSGVTEESSPEEHENASKIYTEIVTTASRRDIMSPDTLHPFSG